MEKYDKSNKGNKNENLELQKRKTMENIKTQFLGQADPDNLDESSFDDIDKNQKKSSGIFSKFTSALKN